MRYFPNFISIIRIMKWIILAFKGTRQLKAIIFCQVTTLITRILFFLNGIDFKSGLSSSGLPNIHISRKGMCSIGKNLILGNWYVINASGFRAKSKIEVRNNAILTIGDNVGMTSATIMCHQKVTIGNYVMIGVGTHIYDTDFHNIDPILRTEKKDPRETVKTAPVIIYDNVFIGAFSIILKGVTIGKNSVVAAGSVVTKSIPQNQVWGGNPAKFIKEL